MRRRRNTDRQRVGLTGFQLIRHIEDAANESALGRAELRTVQPDLRGIVDAIEGERQLPASQFLGRDELRAVPVTLVRQRFGDDQVVEPMVGVGIDTAIDQRREHRARYGRRVPLVVAIPRARERIATLGDLRLFAHAPVRQRPYIKGFVFLQRCGGNRRCRHGFVRGRLGFGKCPRILRFLQPAPRALLPGPSCPDVVEHDEIERGPGCRERMHIRRTECLVIHLQVGHRTAEMLVRKRIAHVRREVHSGCDGVGLDRVRQHFTAIRIQSRGASVVGRGDVRPLLCRKIRVARERITAAWAKRELACSKHQAATGGRGCVANRGDDNRLRALARRIDPSADGPRCVGSEQRHVGGKWARQPHAAFEEGDVVGPDVRARVGSGRGGKRGEREAARHDERCRCRSAPQPSHLMPLSSADGDCAGDQSLLEGPSSCRLPFDPPLSPGRRAERRYRAHRRCAARAPSGSASCPRRTARST